MLNKSCKSYVAKVRQYIFYSIYTASRVCGTYMSCSAFCGFKVAAVLWRFNVFTISISFKVK